MCRQACKHVHVRFLRLEAPCAFRATLAACAATNHCGFVVQMQGDWNLTPEVGDHIMVNWPGNRPGELTMVNWPEGPYSNLLLTSALLPKPHGRFLKNMLRT